jgi:ribonuclease BN (tRNA processing enzyme)
MRVTVLGSGDAFSSGGRGHAAYLVETGTSTFLIDCGSQVLQSMKRFGRDPAELDFVLLSHLHGDHFGGVPYLFMDYRYESRRARPFAVYGPPDTSRRVEGLFDALYEKTSLDPSPFPVTFSELASNVPTRIGDVVVTPMPVRHAADMVCFALRITAGDKTLLYSGDSAWTDDFVPWSQGADLFICECTYFETRFDMHISYPDLAAKAPQLGCRRLLLSHLGSEPLRRRSEITLECAEDGMVLDL